MFVLLCIYFNTNQMNQSVGTSVKDLILNSLSHYLDSIMWWCLMLSSVQGHHLHWPASLFFYLAAIELWHSALHSEKWNTGSHVGCVLVCALPSARPPSSAICRLQNLHECVFKFSLKDISSPCFCCMNDCHGASLGSSIEYCQHLHNKPKDDSLL